MIINTFYINLYPLINEVFLLITICFLLIFSSIFSSSLKFKFPLLNSCNQFYFLQILIFNLILLLNWSPIFVSFWNNLMIIDSFSYYSKILLIFFSLAWFLIYYSYSKILNFEFWILILLSVVGICFLTQVYDLLSIYIIIEFISLSFYILASFNRSSEFSTEAGLKYFILGAFASALLLFSFSILYSFTGLTNLQDLSTFFTGYKINLFLPLHFALFTSILCALTSFLFKLGAAPFHFWLPDVYEGCLNPVTAFFAILSKIGFLNLIIRFTFILISNNYFSKIYYYFLIIILLSSLIGTAGAFLQHKWKRFIAFSSVNHLSFFLLNFCCLNPNNLNNLFFYLVIYLFMTTSFFSFFHFYKFYKYPRFSYPRFLNSLTFLNFSNPLLSFSFLIILFSFSGIPPLAGFFSKYFVLFSAISENFFFSVLIILILNCISGFYYINLVRKNYFNNIDFIYLPICDCQSSFTNSVVLIIFGLVLSFIFIDIEFIFLFTNLMQNAFLN